MAKKWRKFQCILCNIGGCWQQGTILKFSITQTWKWAVVSSIWLFTKVSVGWGILMGHPVPTLNQSILWSKWYLSNLKCIFSKSETVIGIYWGITNHHRLGGIKQHTAVTLQFLWGRSPGWAQLGSLLLGLSWATVRLSVWLWSHRKAPLGKEGPASKPTWPCGDSVPGGLLTWGPQFLVWRWPMSPSGSRWLLHMAACFIQDSKVEALPARRQFLQSQKGYSATFATVS